MGISKRLQLYLEERQVHYELVEHKPSFTAQQTADAGHISGNKVIKAVVLVCDGEFAMVALPAVYMIDIKKFCGVSGATDVMLATEEEIASLFPGDEVGAEPPIGQLYGLSTFLDTSLEQCSEVYFSAGTHSTLCRMSLHDYLEIAKPVTIGDLSRHV